MLTYVILFKKNIYFKIVMQPEPKIPTTPQAPPLSSIIKADPSPIQSPKDTNPPNSFNNLYITTNTTPSSSSTSALSSPVLQTNSATSKRVNFLNNPAKLDRLVNEVNKFENHVNSLSKKTLSTTTILEKEWKELQDYQEKQTAGMTISVARCYPNKNRYQDLLPFDQTRVVLQSRKSDDYINATLIGQLGADLDYNSSSSSQSKHPNFVISQLPYASNSPDLFDFWSMIFQQQTELIVCLCRDNEFSSSSSNSNQYYWPVDKQTPLNVLSLRISLQSVKETQNSIQRVCTVTNTLDNQTRTVVILQHVNKSSSSALIQAPAATTGIGLNEMPENIAGFLKFIKECNNFYLTQQRNSNNPIVVHCMNGVSRSAVFILVYTMIQIIDGMCESSVQAPLSISSDLLMRLIKQMRSRRKYMIQSMHHLKYSYESVLYYLKDILIKEGVLNSSSYGGDVNGSNNLNDSKSTPRKESIDMNLIINDESLVSIQSSKDKIFMNTSPNGVVDNKNVTENGNGLKNENGNGISVSQMESPVQKPISIIEICDPNKFSLDLNDSSSVKKNKITKKDFFNPSSSNLQASLNDPFSLLDSLKK